MYAVTIDQLQNMYDRIQDLHNKAVGMTAEEYHCRNKCNQVLSDLSDIMQDHGTLAFFTQEDHKIFLNSEFVDKLQYLVGWL